jgi:hypothetical protein
MSKKKVKKSNSIHSLQERESMAREILKDAGYKPKEIADIIDRAFYESSGSNG